MYRASARKHHQHSGAWRLRAPCNRTAGAPRPQTRGRLETHPRRTQRTPSPHRPPASRPQCVTRVDVGAADANRRAWICKRSEFAARLPRAKTSSPSVAACCAAAAAAAAAAHVSTLCSNSQTEACVRAPCLAGEDADHAVLAVLSLRTARGECAPQSCGLQRMVAQATPAARAVGCTGMDAGLHTATTVSVTATMVTGVSSTCPVRQ